MPKKAIIAAEQNRPCFTPDHWVHATATAATPQQEDDRILMVLFDTLLCRTSQHQRSHHQPAQDTVIGIGTGGKRVEISRPRCWGVTGCSLLVFQKQS